MDVDISRWILEFLVCHPRVSDSEVKLAFSMLPLPREDPLFMKSMVLRLIQSEIDEKVSISEKLLEFMEVLEEIDRNAGVPIAESMKEAYRAVAVECSVRYIHGARLEKLGKFAEAVRRIWAGRIWVMEQSAAKSELLTPELLQWGRRIEAAVSDGTECLNLMMINTRADAFVAVQGYVTDALEKMRPSFLETIAAHVEPGMHTNPCEEISVADESAESAGEAGAWVNHEDRSIPPGHGEGAPIDATETSRRAKEPVEIHELRRSKRPPRYKRKTAGPAIRTIEESRNEALCTEYDFIPSPDVSKMQDALRSSSSELQAIVEDPLPDALQVAGLLGSGGANHAAQEQTRKVFTTKDADNNVEVNPTIVEENGPNVVWVRHSDVRRPTLMERKSSARTGEWEDSIEDSLEESTSDGERPMLSSRKRKAVSPLRMPQVPRLCRLGQKKRWSTEEEDALRNGVQRFGKGNWKVILNCYRNTFDERTEVDLKDKWRNITR